MKVLLIHDYSSLDGGAEIGTLTLRDGLRSRGFDVRTFTASTGPNQIADYLCLGTKGSFRTLLQSANPSAYYQLRRVLREFQPDVVHVRMFLTQLSPLILPLLREIPTVYHAVWYRAVCPIGTKMLPGGANCEHQPGVACFKEGCLPAWDWAPLMLQMRLLARWRVVFDVVVANSEAVKQSLEDGGIRPVQVIPNGVRERPRAQLDPAVPLAGFAGRLVKPKGVATLLQAFAQVPRGRLLIAGDGDERTSLEELARGLGIAERVNFLGHLTSTDLDRRFSRLWVQVIPSLWREPFGFVAPEAMMRGTAVIASAAGGLLDVVQHEKTGLLIPAGDVTALRDALNRMFDQPELAAKMGQAGREVALAEFHESVWLDRFAEVYDGLIRRKSVL